MIPMIVTKDGINFMLGSKPYHVARTDPHFEDVYNAVKNDADDWEIEDILNRVKNQLGKLQELSPRLSFDGAAVWFDGEILRNYAADRLIDLIANDDPVDPVVNFLENLLENPSKTVVDNLYSFLEHGRIPLTQDGHFLAYKAIKLDWTDIYTGKFDNSIGAKPEMSRNKVDEDRNRTCSTGFHVCSYEYLPHFAHANGHVVVCKVNPADVVAIPGDYNDTKMRVCKYEVIGEVDDYYRKEENVLTTQPYFQVGGVDPDGYGFDEDEEDEEMDGALDTCSAGDDTYTIRIRRHGEQVSSVLEDGVQGYRTAHRTAEAAFIAGAGVDVAAVAVVNDNTDELMYTWGLWTA